MDVLEPVLFTLLQRLFYSSKTASAIITISLGSIIFCLIVTYQPSVVYNRAKPQQLRFKPNIEHTFPTNKFKYEEEEDGEEKEEEEEEGERAN